MMIIEYLNENKKITKEEIRIVRFGIEEISVVTMNGYSKYIQIKDISEIREESKECV